MYHSSGMDFSREPGLVTMTFVWPHGGRSVYICGSFTGWTQYPMAPVEGYPTVFQAICTLPPGYHQYKFVVDGEWRHDEHQPYIAGNYGTVNTVLVARGSDYRPPMLNPQIPHGSQILLGSNMDIDNEAFQRLV